MYVFGYYIVSSTDNAKFVTIEKLMRVCLIRHVSLRMVSDDRFINEWYIWLCRCVDRYWTV
jgi:hypothetical protein